MAPLFLNTDTAFDLEARVAYDRGASLSIPDISEMTIPRQSLAARIDLDNPRFSLVLENLGGHHGGSGNENIRICR